jgi:hypothetical protein
VPSQLRRPPCGPRKAVLQLVGGGEKPNVVATAGLTHKIAEGSVLLVVARNIANNREPNSILRKFLEDRTRDAACQGEEILVEPFNWKKEKVGTLLVGFAGQIDRVAIAADFLSPGSQARTGRGSCISWRHC